MLRLEVMTTEDQSEVVAFLGSPSAHGGAAVERIDTHASIVFLSGTRAWKLKRAVRYDFLDFSTAPQRRAMCEAEFRLNRRTSPALYHAVIPVTREAGGALAIGGHGAPVDWLIEMARFDQEALFDRLAERHALPLEWMRPLGAAIARVHATAERRHDQGGQPGMAWVIDGNETGFAEYGADILPRAVCDQVTRRTRSAFQRQSTLLDARRDDGFVRQCHGDLHLRNIVWFDGHPTLFDAIEFNDRIGCIDVLYDVAFLLMDLWRRQLRAHANAVWNAYLFESGDLGGLSLLPLFLSCRAAVRAKTDSLEARLQQDPGRRAMLEATAREYLSMALELLAPAPACLVAIGGLSGSGKSMLAQRLAPAVGAVPGAVVIRSDEIRKRLSGVDPSTRLSGEAYTPAMSQRVYATAIDRARAVVRTGHSAIVDAVFAEPDDRRTIEDTAAAASVPFLGIWLEAPESVLIARVNTRQHDASDANAAVVHAQRARDAGPISWTRINSLEPADSVVRAVAELLATLMPTRVHQTG